MLGLALGAEIGRDQRDEPVSPFDDASGQPGRGDRRPPRGIEVAVVRPRLEVAPEIAALEQAAEPRLVLDRGSGEAREEELQDLAIAPGKDVRLAPATDEITQGGPVPGAVAARLDLAT